MPGPAERVGTGLLDLLTLERVETNLFLTTAVHDGDGPAGLYGGQVAAQALRAATATVDPDRHPHSLHGYFLSRGDASRRVLLTVYRDRDGRSYSNRRVIALQQGKVIFNMAASFHLAEPGPDYQAHLAPDVAGPDGLPELETRFSLHGIDIRVPEQPRAGQQWPSRVWLRARDALADETLHDCALAYVSDMFTGLAAVPGIRPAGPRPASTTRSGSTAGCRSTTGCSWTCSRSRSRAAGGCTRGGSSAGTSRLAAGIAQESVYRTA